MAVTRIKTNQITDGAVTNGKVADYSIEGGKLANSFTYGSDFTVSGNLTVNGTTTTVDTVNTTIDDPILLVGSNQTGAGAVDLGILGERGDDTNVFVGYDESADEFVTALVSDAESSTTVTITDYANMHVGGLTADDAITATGNITGGNLITSAAVESATVTATGAVTGGSLTDGTATLSSGALSGATSGSFSTTLTATGNITGGNLLTAGDVEAVNVDASGTATVGTLTDGTATLTSGSLTGATNVTASGTVTGGTLTDGTASISSGAVSGVTTLATSGEATLASATVSDLTSGRVVLAGTSGAIEDSTNLTFDGSTLAVTGAVTASTTATVTGNITGGNLVTSGKFDNGSTNIEGGNISNGNTVKVQSNGGMGDSALVATNNAVQFLNDGGDVEFLYGALASATKYFAIGKGTGNIVEFDTESDGGIEVNTYVTATGNITGGNLITAGTVDTATLGTSGAATLGGTLDVTGNTTVANFAVDASSTLDFNENTLGNVGTPVATADAATKGYVDNLLSSGFTISDSEDTPNTQTIAQGDTLTIAGTTNEITAIVSATDTLTLGLPDDVTIGRDLTVTGNLSVLGTQTIVDSTTSSIVDPILQLGRGANNAALTSNDGKDRGISMYYYDGSEKVAFFGFDDPSDEFRFIPEATISDEAVTGSLGTANLGKVRVDNIDIDGNTLEATSGNLTIQAAGTDKIVLPTGNELVITDMGDTGVLYSNSGEVSADASNFYYDGTELYAQNMYSGGYLNVDGTANVATLEVAGDAAIDGAITSVTDITASGVVTVTGNVTGGNLITSALVSAATVTATGTVTGGTLTDGTASINAGAITGATSGSFSTTLTATGNITGGNLITSAAVESATVTATGAVTGGSLTDGTATLSSGALSGATTGTFSGNVTAGNLVTAGVVDNGTITMSNGNLSSSGSLRMLHNGGMGDGEVVVGPGVITLKSDSGTVNFSTTGLGNVRNHLTIASSGNVTQFQTLEGATFDDYVTVTGNLTGGNLITSAAVESATVTATGTVTGGTLTDGTMSVNAGAVTGVASLAVDNITIDGDDITTSGSALTINDAGADVDFRVEGSTNANMLVVDAGSDAVMIGTATATTDVSFKIGSTDAMMVPVGTTAQRPTVGAGGMIRYNSTTDQYEAYDVSEAQFKALGVPAFTTIASQTFNGDGTTTVFTLSSDQTTQSCIVSINGVVQLPTSAYAVSGNAMTFTEAPESGDTIEVRQITTTTTISGLANGDGTVSIDVTDSGSISTGNFEPDADGTRNLGSVTKGWATIYGEATSAQYADLAEKYEADADYEPGTVVHFGGEKEVAMCDMDHCSKVAGVVSTAPAYRMNDGLEAEHVAMVALTGRVPCKVTGPVAKGDMMVSAGNGMARAESDPKVGTVIGKALENHEGGEGVIEVVVGKH